jgi:hypothetical protein
MKEDSTKDNKVSHGENINSIFGLLNCLLKFKTNRTQNEHFDDEPL